MNSILNLVRPNILNAQKYSSSWDEFSGNADVYLDANENPFGLYNRYPDPGQIKLKLYLSEYKQVDINQIAIGNGSDEIIDLLFRIFCRPSIDKALCFTPTYGMYKVCGQINDVEMIECALDDSFQIDTKSLDDILFNPLIKLLFICSPNNPTGNIIDRKSIEYILNNFSGVVVVDEAYIDFADADSFVNLINKFSNLVVLNTLSKAWALAAARIGVAYSNSQIIDLINKVKAPYNVSQLNQELALSALKREDVFLNNIELIKNERTRIVSFLDKLDFVIQVFPSQTNYILVRFICALKVYEALKQQKIIVRNRSNEIENCLRVTIGRKEENNMLLEVLKTIDL